MLNNEHKVSIIFISHLTWFSNCFENCEIKSSIMAFISKPQLHLWYCIRIWKVKQLFLLRTNIFLPAYLTQTESDSQTFLSLYKLNMSFTPLSAIFRPLGSFHICHRNFLQSILILESTTLQQVTEQLQTPDLCCIEDIWQMY